MSSAKKIKIGNIEFPSISSARNEVRRILHEHEIGTPIENSHDFLFALLLLHPEVDQKNGVGVAHFEVRNNKVWGHKTTRGFWIVRIDGSCIDFSFEACLTGKGKTFDQNLRQAARYAIRRSLHEAKTALFEKPSTSVTVKCDVSDRFLLWEEAEIDHKAPFTFEVIFSAWKVSLNSNEEKQLESAVSQDDYSIQAVFINDLIKYSWVSFHTRFCNKYGCLRVVSKEVHRRLKQNRYIEPNQSIQLNDIA